MKPNITVIAFLIFSAISNAALGSGSRFLKLSMAEDGRIERLDMVNFSYIDIVAILSAMAHVKIDIEKAPVGTMNTSFENLSWKEALEVMFDPLFYTVREKGNGSYVIQKR